MLILHITKSKDTIRILKDEFMTLIKRYQKVEPVKIVEENDPDYLTDEELKQFKIAEEELKQGKTISLKEYDKMRKAK
ncbi:MAG: hypothetical protein KAW87_05070 [Candidatus Cloacimonetes bacterium]|nr:hypothetical protein [Candidatus Cloacimonadota bacterium]